MQQLPLLRASAKSHFYAASLCIAQGVAYDAASSVCLSVMSVSWAKTAKGTEMPFGTWTHGDSKNCVLAGHPNPITERDNSGGHI